MKDELSCSIYSINLKYENIDGISLHITNINDVELGFKGC